MGFRVVRTPGMSRRQARNFDRLTNKNTVTEPGGAIQEVGGSIVIVVAAGEPLTQSSAGIALALAAAGGLEKLASELRVKLVDTSYLTTTTAGLDWSTRRKEQLSHAVNAPMLTPIVAAAVQVATEEAVEESISTALAISFMGL